jgi:hypothetical protein
MKGQTHTRLDTYAHLACICLLAANLSTLSVPAAVDELDKLLSWVRSNGGFFDPRQVLRADEGGLRGVYAATTIAQGDLLLSVPWSLVIEGNVSKYHAPKTDRLRDRALCATIDALAFELAERASGRGNYDAYLAVMEAQQPQLPNTFSEEALTMLADLPPGDDSWRRHTSWFDYFCAAEPPPGVDAGARLRALLLGVTRNVEGCDGSDLDVCRCMMVPVYDMYNHRNGAFHNTVAEHWHADGFVMRATRDIGEGEQLFNSYGVGAPDIFNNYGFVEQPPTTWSFADGLQLDTEGSPRHEFQIVLGGAGGAAGSSSEVQGQGQVVLVQLPAGTDRAAFGAAARRALGRVVERRVVPADGPPHAAPADVQAAWAYRQAFQGALRRAISHADEGGADAPE